MEPIGIVLGLVLAAIVLLALHRVSTKRRSGPDRGAAQAGGVPPDPGASRPAGPGAELQDPAAGGGSHRDDGGS